MKHFINYCFNNEPKSHQVKGSKQNAKAFCADALINVPKDLVYGANKEVIYNVTRKVISETAKLNVISNLAKTAATKALLNNVVALPIQGITEIGFLTRDCLKLKNQVKNGQMSQEDMNKEVTKKTFGAAGALALGGGAVVAASVAIAAAPIAIPAAAVCISVSAISVTAGVLGRFGGSLLGKGVYTIAAEVSYLYFKTLFSLFIN